MKRILISVAALLLFMSCEKEEELTSTTVRKIYPYEGTYSGTFKMDCDSFGIHIKATNLIRITAFDAETYGVDNLQAIGGVNGKISVNNSKYTYINFEALDVTDCGKLVGYSLSGSGQFTDSTLTEIGSGILYRYDIPYFVTWSTTSTKIK